MDCSVVATLKTTMQDVLDWWAEHTGLTFILGMAGDDGENDIVAV